MNLRNFHSANINTSVLVSNQRKKIYPLITRLASCILLVNLLHIQPVHSQDAQKLPPPISEPVSIRLADRGAILTEDFNASVLDSARWRVWQNNPDRSKVFQSDGKLNITSRGSTRMEGLWGLSTGKNKDVVLVGEMDIRSKGPSPHKLSLHLCGSEGHRSPDHWVELIMVDLGETARFSPQASLPLEINRRRDEFIEVPHPPNKSFTGRIELNGNTNLAEFSIKTAEGWKQVCGPIELPLRDIHTEIKFNGQISSDRNEESSSQAWFDNVRIYPRPENHYVGIRLIQANGKAIHFRGNGSGWPPKFTDSHGNIRPITDIEVQLRTADGKNVIAVSQSPCFSFYLLPLKNATWDIYPVSAEIWIVLDGKRLGAPIIIESNGVNGLYPDDVYEIIMQ